MVRRQRLVLFARLTARLERRLDVVAAPPKDIKADIQARYDELPPYDLDRLFDGGDPFAAPAA